MNVYVESNYVLELAFVQDESDACEAILDLASAGRIALVLPALSITEPYETLIRRSKERDDLQARLEQEFAQLGRSKPYEELVRGSSEIVALLGKSGEESRTRLEGLLTRILAVAHLIHIDADLYAEALRLQTERSLKSQDAIIYASVLRHMSAALDVEKCFLNKNVKDFLAPDIKEELEAFQCRVIPSFRDGLDFIRSRLSGG